MKPGFEDLTLFVNKKYYKYIVVYNYPLSGYYSTSYCEKIVVEFGSQFIVAIFKNIKLKKNATATNIITGS